MALIVIVGVWTFGIRQKGLKGYLKHFLEPYPYLLPLNILEELVKPITLALRLFGNIFAGGIMLALIAGLVSLAPGNIPIGGCPGGRPQRRLEAVRHHVPRRPAGLHLRAADRPVLRDGRRRDHEHDEHDGARHRGRPRSQARTRTSALSRTGQQAHQR